MPPAQSPGSERRAWPRRRNRFRVFVADAENEDAPPRCAWAMDRSRGGLRLLIDDEVATGTILKVRPIAAPARLAWVVVRVKNRRRQGNAWELGCKFIKAPSLATLLLFG